MDTLSSRIRDEVEWQRAYIPSRIRDRYRRIGQTILAHTPRHIIYFAVIQAAAMTISGDERPDELGIMEVAQRLESSHGDKKA